MLVARPDPALADPYPHLSIDGCATAWMPLPAGPGPIERPLSLCLGPLTPTTAGTICQDGNGDELCAITAGFHSAPGGVTVLDFLPHPSLIGASDPALDLLFRVTASDVRFNLLRPNGLASAVIPLGTVVVAPSSAGLLVTAESSRWVDASLDERPLPEPSGALALLAPLALLVLFARRGEAAPNVATCASAGRTDARATVAPFAMLLLAPPLFPLLFGSTPAASQVFDDRDAFLSELGPGARHVDFEWLPLSVEGTAQVAALHNGDRQRQARFTALALASDVPLIGGFGLSGTFLAYATGTSAGTVVSPASTNSADDDFVVEFDVPVVAAGIRIANDTDGAGFVRFLDGEDREIRSLPLPGGSGSPTPDAGFFGYAVRPGERSIQKIVVEEDDSGGPSDDLVFDDVVYAFADEPDADLVVAFQPQIVAGNPPLDARDATRALDAADGRGVSLGTGGSLVVRFADNALAGSGTPAPDLRIVELTSPFDESSLVEISPDGQAWTLLDKVSGPTGDIDLDAHGFGPNHVIAFVRVTDDAADTPVGDPSAGADIDAIVALTSVPAPADQDFDGVPDAVDVCPAVFNPGQADGDQDGVGDVCDNCSDRANAGQDDVNQNGRGDACDDPRVWLRQLPADPQTGETLADVFLDCGGESINRVNFGVVAPPGVDLAQASFAGCGAPRPGVGPPGLPTGSGCEPTALLGQNVDADASGVVGPSRSLPNGMRLDTAYVLLGGNGPNGELCTPFKEGVFLGRFTTGPVDPPGGVALLGRSILTHEGLSVVNLPRALTTPGQAVPCMLMSTTGFSQIVVFATPAAGETSDTVDRWQICFDFDPNLGHVAEDMNRVTFGIGGPPGVSPSELSLAGCAASGATLGVPNLCSADPAAIDPTGVVSEGNSLSYGPFGSRDASALAAVGLETDTLYVALEGSYGGGGPLLPRLNRPLVGPWCVATIEVPPSMAGLDPTFRLDGLDALPFKDADPVPLRVTDGNPLGVLTLNVAAQYNTGVDRDGDFMLDDYDNCKYAYNPGQENQGDFGTIYTPGSGSFDLDGDACECGDTNATGGVLQSLSEEPSGSATASDVDRIRAYLIGATDDPAIRDLCSADADPHCDTADLVRLKKAFSASGLFTPGFCYSALPDEAD
ncbi:MAG: hypothetical protein R3F35_14895 [Myxococcota bacterium]